MLKVLKNSWFTVKLFFQIFSFRHAIHDHDGAWPETTLWVNGRKFFWPAGSQNWELQDQTGQE